MSACGVCGRQRWHRSRVRDSRGEVLLVCQLCHPDPVDALEVLARREGPAMVARVQGWREAAEASTRLMKGVEFHA